MLNIEEIYSAMEEICKDKLLVNIEKPFVFEDTFVEDLGLDSIMFLELLVEMEIKYDIEINLTELDNSLKQIGYFVQFIQEKVQRKED